MKAKNYRNNRNGNGIRLNNLVRLKKSHVKAAGEMLARAFQDHPLFAYFVPNTLQRQRKSPYIFEALLRYNVSYGEVYATSPNLEGVAGWLHSEKAQITPWRIIRAMDPVILFNYSKVGKEILSRTTSYDNYVSSKHKSHAPFRHWYLSFLGVDPMFQGKGYASRLLRPMLTRIDQEHLPCYLETQNEKNLPIYQHYGFEVVDESTIPNTEVTNWSMLRESSKP